MADEVHSLSVSSGSAFNELNADILPKRNRRNRKRDTYPRAVEKRQMQNLVKRKEIFDSRNNASFTDGVISIADGAALTINATITDVNDSLWMMIPEWSMFIDTVAASNEWPNGSFFSSASNRQDPDNYNIISNIKEFTSTDPVIKWTIRFTNNTGASVKIGCTLGIRFLVNRDESPS